MGQNNLGHDIFLIKLAISYSSYYVPSRPIHIYVKMGDQQLQVTDINLTPLK